MARKTKPPTPRRRVGVKNVDVRQDALLGSHGPKFDAKRATIADKKAYVVELRTQGVPYAKIANLVDCSPPEAHRLFEQALAEVVADSVEQMRHVENARLDALLESHWDGRKEIGHAQIVLGCVAARIKLNGLAVPVRTELTGVNGGPIQTIDVTQLSDEQLEELARGPTPAGPTPPREPPPALPAGPGGVGAPPAPAPERAPS